MSHSTKAAATGQREPTSTERMASRSRITIYQPLLAALSGAGETEPLVTLNLYDGFEG